MTFDAVPPGQQPTRMTPIANSCGSAKTCVSPHANNGMTVNCVRQPMSISVGRRSMSLKSFAVSVSPMPNMMMPNIGLITHVPIHTSEAGNIKLNAATASTNTPIQWAIKSQTRCIGSTNQPFISRQPSGSATFCIATAALKSGAISSSLKPAIPQPIRVT